MGYSRRDLYALGEPLGESVTRKKAGGGMVYGGGDTPSPQPTTSTAYNTNIPEYAKPYVTNMLEATQKQLFKGNTDENGNFNITGFQPYTPYSNDPSKYVAGFSPLQQQAQSGVANLQMPGQYQAGSQLAGMGGMGSMGIARQAANAGNNYYNMATNPGAVNQFMNPYLQNALQPQLNQLAQQGNIASQQAAASATGSGAFGGTRGALAQNLAQQNALMAQQNALGQGYNNAYNQAMQNMQYGAGLGLQGQQTALQGYGQGIQAAGALGQLGQQQLTGQEGILSAQNAAGQQQQAQQQQIINQDIQNYATAQQYPMMQLGLMSNMLRGLPMQATTTQSYQAQPSALTQGIGALGTAAGAYKVFGAKGGLPKHFERRYESGGVAESIKSQLESMDDAHLAQILQSSSSKEIKQMASQVLAEHEMAQKVANQGLGAAPSNMTTRMAGGGIVAFAAGDVVEDTSGGGGYDPTAVAKPEKNPLVPDNPYAATPEAALEKYIAMRKTAGANEGDPYAKYGEAIQAKIADAAAAKDRMIGENMMQYFTNYGTQTGSGLMPGLKAGKDTLPDIVKNRQAFEKEQLGYEAAGAELAHKKDVAAEAMAKEASTLYEKGADIQEKLSAKLIEAQKTKSLPNLQELTKINYEYLIAQDPSIANDPVKSKKAKVDATNTAVQQLGYIQQQIAGARTAVQAAGVDVSQQGVNVNKVTASTAIDDKEQARADGEIAKDGLLKKWATDLYGAENKAEEKTILDKIEKRENTIRTRVKGEFAGSRAALSALDGGKGTGTKKDKPIEYNKDGTRKS